MHSSTSHNLALFSPKTLALIGSNKFLGWMVVIALLHSALYFQAIIETDGASYVRIAETLANEFRLRANSLVFTPGYPLLVAPFLRLTGDGELSGELVSLLATLASVALAGLLGRRLFGPTTGGIAALLLALSVFFMQKSYWVMSEPAYSFFMVASAYLVIGLLQQYAHGKAVLLGISLAFLELTRPEGLVPALVVLLGLAGLAVFGGKQRRKLLLGASLAFTILAAGHFWQVVQVHELTGKWVQNTKLHNNWYVAHKRKYAAEHGISNKDAYQWIQRGVDDSGAKGTARFPEPKILDEVLADPKYYARHYLKNLRKEAVVLLTAMNVILPFAVFGIICALRDANTRTGSLFLLAFTLTLAVYPFFYISERNVETVLPILYVFGAVGMLRAFTWYQGTVTARASPGRTKTLIRSALVATAIIVLGPVCATVAASAWELHSPPSQPAYVHKVAGMWLRDHSRPAAVVMSRKPWVAFYAHRNPTSLPYGDAAEVLDQARKRGATYVVVDDRYTRPQLHEPPFHEQFAGEIAAHRLQPVFTIEGKGNRLVIYEVASSRRD